MKQLIIILLFLLQGSWLFAQQEKSLVHKGNELYQQKKYTEAEANYRKSMEKRKNVEGDFNLGDALFKQKKFTEAGEQFNQLAGASSNKNIAAKAYHNLGNSLLENKKLEESIDAYKKSLINNPKDEETRYNLAYAQEKLKEQQKKDKDNKDKKKNDKNQDKKNQNKDDKNKDNKDQNKKDQDKKDQDKKDQDKKDQDKKDQKDGQQPQPNKLSKEDAERMLDALNNDEKQTQEKLKNKKLKGVKMHIEKDW